MKTLFKTLVFFGTFYFLAVSAIPLDSDGSTGIGDALSLNFKETFTVGVALMVWSLLLGIISPIGIKVLCLTHVMKDKDLNSSIQIIKRIVLTLCTVGVIICLLALFWPS